MKKGPTTTRDIGVFNQPGWIADEKYRQVRNQAKKIEAEVCTRAKVKKKSKEGISPTYKIGEFVVLIDQRIQNKKANYFYVEVLDCSKGTARSYYSTGDTHTYYGIVHRVTHDKHKKDLGRLIHFNKIGLLYGYAIPANVEVEAVKWKHEATYDETSQVWEVQTNS